MSLTTTLPSGAVYNIAYAYALAFAPHLYKLVALSTAGYKWNGTFGRSNMTTAQGKVSTAVYERAKRADMAHLNGQESWPLFAAAVLAAGAAGVEAEVVSRAGRLYLGFRLAYNIVYIYGTNQAIAGLRTAVWGGSLYASVNLLLKAAKALAARGL